ncbi:MAG: cupredoxin domain-containing protein [Thermoplasmatota archaeon]
MKAAVLLLAAAGALLAGCSTTPTAVTPPLDQAGHYVIALTSSNLFDPAHAKVPVGSTVTWLNQADIRHDVTSDDGLFQSPGGTGGLAKAGSSFSFQFTHAGTFGYHCNVHRDIGMSGTIQVG